MTAEIIQLIPKDKHNTIETNNVALISCPCTDEGSILVPQVLMVENKYPLITGLVCMECETFIPVTDGKVGYDN